MDEPCSALDPIATLKVEELIFTLKTQYTIVIVTHNLQQAARVSDKTAFFWLGRLDRVQQHAGAVHEPRARSTRTTTSRGGSADGASFPRGAPAL